MAFWAGFGLLCQYHAENVLETGQAGNLHSKTMFCLAKICFIYTINSKNLSLCGPKTQTVALHSETPSI